MILLLKSETLRKLAETCTSGLHKLKLNGNEWTVSALLKLYTNLLHQVSANWNFAETFPYVSEDWNVHIRFLLAGTWRNPAETIEEFLHCWNSTGNFDSKFPCRGNSIGQIRWTPALILFCSVSTLHIKMKHFKIDVLFTVRIRFG